VARTTSPEQPPLSLGPEAITVRRAVGPIAWAVLECVAASAIRRDDETVSYESARGIAGTLGLAKDTAARALRRLAAAQLVTYVPSRGDNGRFGTSHYRLTLPTDVFNIVPPQPAPTESPVPITAPTARARPNCH